MAWSTFQDQNGNWWMSNFDMIYALVRASVRATEIKTRSSIETIDNGFFSPDTFQITTDWNGFAGTVEISSNSLFAQIASDILVAPQSQLEGLANLRANYTSDTQAVIDMQTQAQSQTDASISSSVGFGSAMLVIAQAVATGASTFLLTAATIASGGAAAALAAEGIVISASATAAGGGSVGDVAFTTAATVVQGALGGMDGNTTVLFVGSLLSGGFDGAASLVSGESAGTALGKAATSAGITFLSSGFGPQTKGLVFGGQAFVRAAAWQAAGGAANSTAANIITAVNTPLTVGAVTHGAAVEGFRIQSDTDYVNNFLLSQGISSGP